MARPRNIDHLEDLIEEVCKNSIGVRGDIRSVVVGEIDRLAPLASEPDRDHIITRSVARMNGLDALGEYLSDPAVDEVMVNSGREVWVDRDGCLSRVAELPDGAIDVVLERILAPLGKRLDRTNPVVDARLEGGARLCAVVAPIAVDGTTVSIRHHRHRHIGLRSFASPEVADLLEIIVKRRANLLITGATSSGKTTCLAALVGVAAASDRIVVIEDTSELVIDGHHTVRLEARTAGADGGANITLDHLVRTALRLRPDRLVIGEFRGSEVLAVVQALNTGHDGSFATCHANSAVDGLRRVETLTMQAAPTWPLAAIRRHITRSFDVVVHLERAQNGNRQITEIIEVVESSDEPTGRVLADRSTTVAHLTRGRS